MILLLVACSSSPPPRLYVLSAAEKPAQAGVAASGSSLPPSVRAGAARRGRPALIGVAPVTLPEYLDRPEVIQRMSDNEIEVDEQQRWAERLSTNATRVLVENLNTFVGNERVVPLPARAITTYDVSLDLSRFDIDSDHTVVMVGRWSIVDNGSNTEVSSGPVRLRQAVSASGFNSIAAAMSKNLEVAARDIANAIQQLPTEPQRALRREASPPARRKSGGR